MRKINTALCSFGMSGRVFHAPFLEAHPGFELYAVWERSKKSVKGLYPSVLSYNDYEELLDDKAVELVIVNTPIYTHYDFAKAALLAGKHVIVEKAFTVTITQAEELIQIAKEQGRKLSVFQNRRWDSDFKTVRKIVDEKHLGKIVEAEFHFDRYNLALSPKVHKETPGPGAGVLHDLGPHIIDQVLQLFGIPEALFADIRIIRPSSQVSDYFDILLYYPALRVHLRSSYIVKEPLPAYILHGTQGSFLKHRADVQEVALQSGMKPAGEDWGQEPAWAKGILHKTGKEKDSREEITALPGNYMEYYQAIYEALTDNNPLPVTGEEGLLVMKIIETAINSHVQKKVLDIA
jgi:scyllo-inositol 2-dehydrogenase (NADP+)